jgi:hypothetical protein
MRILKIIAVFWCLLNLEAVAQDSITRDKILQSAKLQAIRSKTDTVILYRRFTSWNCDEPYEVLAIHSGRISGYQFSLPDKLVKCNTAYDTLKRSVNLFYRYNILEIPGGNWSDSCSEQAPGCGDCQEYAFILLTKTGARFLYFYEPEIYVQFCPYVNRNERILELIRTLWNHM